ncbi:MAG: hypothetical protein ACPHL6_01205 [Rubripirellula sp.]
MREGIQKTDFIIQSLFALPLWKKDAWCDRGIRLPCLALPDVGEVGGNFAFCNSREVIIEFQSMLSGICTPYFDVF